MKGLSRLGDHSIILRTVCGRLPEKERSGRAAGWVGVQNGLLEVDVIPAMHTRQSPQVS